MYELLNERDTVHWLHPSPECEVYTTIDHDTTLRLTNPKRPRSKLVPWVHTLIGARRRYLNSEYCVYVRHTVVLIRRLVRFDVSPSKLAWYPKSMYSPLSKSPMEKAPHLWDITLATFHVSFYIFSLDILNLYVF